MVKNKTTGATIISEVVNKQTYCHADHWFDFAAAALDMEKNFAYYSNYFL